MGWGYREPNRHDSKLPSHPSARIVRNDPKRYRLITQTGEVIYNTRAKAEQAFKDHIRMIDLYRKFLL